MAGRPREFDYEAALAQIQQAFWCHGYEGTSMADLVSATGLASARLYAAFGSKQDMFHAAVQRYMWVEGSFADRALAEEPQVHDALARMLRDAVTVYSKPTPRGCMVVTAATNCTLANDEIRVWLERHRHARTKSIITRLRAAVTDGQLPPSTDVQLLGDYFATVLNGLSTQARDGVSPNRLLAVIDSALAILPTQIPTDQ